MLESPYFELPILVISSSQSFSVKLESYLALIYSFLSQNSIHLIAPLSFAASLALLSSSNNFLPCQPISLSSSRVIRFLPRTSYLESSWPYFIPCSKVDPLDPSNSLKMAEVTGATFALGVMAEYIYLFSTLFPPECASH